MVDIAALNARAWDWESEHGNRWTDGCSPQQIAMAKAGQPPVVLSPFKTVPLPWIRPLEGRRILCLASGGGQQGILLSAAGAKVTVLDISPRQVNKDRQTAEKEHLAVETVVGDMRDLSRFSPASFDMVFNPTSTCFVDDAETVYRQCSRILIPGGILLTSVTNPVLYLFDEKKVMKGKLKVKYTIPFSDPVSLGEKELKRRLAAHDTVEFSHTLDGLLGGICRSGFSIDGMYSDGSGFEILDSFVHDCFLAVRARKTDGLL